MEPSVFRLPQIPELVAVSSRELVASVEHGSLSLLQGEPPGLSSAAEQPAPQVEAQDHLPEQQLTETQQGRTTMLIRVLGFLGQGPAGTAYRKSLVRLIWNLSWGFLQVITVIVMLILVGTYLKSPSPKFSELSEWDACDRPLGLWASLWILRVILASSLAFWEFRRDRILHPRQQDVEQNTTGAQVVGARINLGDVARPNPMSPGNQGGSGIDPQSLPHTHLYSRLTLLSSLITLSWFLTANILAYTSIDTCRHAAPHLWWLIFAILCIMYLMVLEVVVLGFVVLVVAPILFIFWNIFLICLGRHPMQNAGMIKPEIGKLSKAVVDDIPLVIYIPAPEEGAKETTVQIPHVYPPKHQTEHRKIRFRLLRVFFKPKSTKSVAVDKQLEGKLNSLEPDSWVDNWEQGEYPFVTLEGNRAACAICLQDYEEPKRKVADNQAANEEKGKSSSDFAEGSRLSVKAPEPTNVTEDARRIDNLKLADAGEAVQPLRLLGCGHVFHKTCVDPWLIDVSGRCPVCQRAVEPSKPYKSKRLP